MRILWCVAQEWMRTQEGFELISTYDDGSKSAIVTVVKTFAGWSSKNCNDPRWRGPFRLAISAVRYQRHWYEPFRNLCREVRLSKTAGEKGAAT